MVHVDELQKLGIYVIDGQSSKVVHGIQCRSYLCFYLHAPLSQALLAYIPRHRMHYVVQNAFECMSSCDLIANKQTIVSKKRMVCSSLPCRHLSLTSSILQFPMSYDTYMVLWNRAWSACFSKAFTRLFDVDSKLIRILQHIEMIQKKKLYKYM